MGSVSSTVARYRFVSSAVLDIDMGNTRTKWRFGNAAGHLPSPQLPKLDSKPGRVRVATVLRNRDAVAQTVGERFGLEAEFASTSATLAGVRCGYRDPARLGVDRWLALVAAWHLTDGAVAVIGAGTAATVDFVHADGRHEGGHIAPGLGLMRNALNHTADVRPEYAAEAVATPGNDTEGAVSSGTLVMLLGFVEAAVGAFAERCPTPPDVVLTGGDAELLCAHLTVSARHEPHLVLDGLAIALP
ncbi:MAG: type III pantothenate kinase [Gammaproteobacteria bacterium]|nr:type III pantothenate kinase [Gammaproteobacteria bacterium]